VGRTRDASDLYRHLAEGPDVASHGLYNYQAARLLVELGEAELARRYLARAHELMKDDDLAARLDELER
jgi:hypothetical protein